MSLPTAVYKMWYCGDEHCACNQLHIRDKETGALLAEGPYTSGGEFDRVGTMEAIVKFMDENSHTYTHEFCPSLYYTLEAITSMAWKYSELEV
jgi:hypothetical protein